MTLDDKFLDDLCTDISKAERLNLPGPAKHGFVVACQIQRYSHSDPSPVVWILIALLEKLIPIVVDWLKKHYATPMTTGAPPAKR